MIPPGYGYQMPTAAGGGGMIMPMQGWGVPQQRYVRSTPAAQQSAKRIRKRSEGQIHKCHFIKLNASPHRCKKMSILQCNKLSHC